MYLFIYISLSSQPFLVSSTRGFGPCLPRGSVLFVALGMDRSAVAAHRHELFRRGSNRVLKSTVDWLSRHMLEMDWVERHELHAAMVIRKSARFITMLNLCFGDDQLLAGTLTALASPSPAIPLQNMSLKRPMVQMKIGEFFAKKPRQ
jgi:hypothetical protein